MIKKYVMRVCRLLVDVARSVTRAVEEGSMPYQLSPTAMEENVSWGRRWIASAVVSLIAGETIKISRIDVVMLVLFVASVVVTRRGFHRPVIVYQAAHTT